MYPGPGYPAYPPYGYTPPPPSGGTAITAGILALVCGLYNGYNVVDGLLAVQRLEDARRSLGSSALASDLDDELYLLIATSAGIAGAFVLGGILLLARKGSGRVLIVLACVAAVFVGLVNQDTLERAGLAGSAASTVGWALGVGLPLFVGILTAVGTTARWVAAGRRPAVPPPMYGQPPMYGPPPNHYAPPQYPHY
ncbi:hypothetical protein AB0H49_30050 [Nocardia sp. NPDC050713]|uniref:hypothetical protein n=1 Tax=unclassified Nocardia TaxID=2637762 RepID=UPI0033AE6D99